MNLPSHMLAEAHDLLGAVRVLHRRGMVDLLRPDLTLRASWAIRRYGVFGGLTAYASRRYGDAPAITDECGTVSFRELDETSNALARGLQANGIRPGWVIAALHRNDRVIMVTLSAANKIGARVVLMNTGFAGPQLADVCARERVRCILADDEFTDLIDELPAETMRVRSSKQHELIDDQSRSALPAPPRPGGMVLLTSGTTGTPKGAPRNRIDPLQSAQLLDRVGWPVGGTYCVAAPLFHATGLATCALGLALGNRIVLARRFRSKSRICLPTIPTSSTPRWWVSTIQTSANGWPPTLSGTQRQTSTSRTSRPACGHTSLATRCRETSCL